MTLLKLILWTGAFVIFYSYFGYGLVVFFITRIRRLGKNRKNESTSLFQPRITLVVAAFNEEDFIEKKIANSLALDYDQEKLDIIIITDGSTDKTPELVSANTRIRHMHRPERLGKVAAMHRAMAAVETDIVVFSDANTLLNKEAIIHIARHYANPGVGGVAGEKKIIKTDDNTTNGASEGLYWKYESFLKKLDWELYSVVGAAGELFSVRKELYEHPGDNVLLDDFIISLRVCMKGYRVAYEPDAFATETPSFDIEEERKRKIRISAGGFQSIVMLKELLKFWKTPVLSFQYISHRVLRWTLCPLFLPLVLLANIWIVLFDPSPLYIAVLIAQAGFYLFAFLGWFLPRINMDPGKFYVFYYFVFMNVSLYAGLNRFLKGKQTVIWDKALRTKI